jgi:predicted transglutaminase-like cysteine proteinase
VIGGATTEAQPLGSLPSRADPIEKNGSARPVSAWVKFCERFPAECAVDTAEVAVMEMTPTLWNALTAVNRRVNGRVKPMTDRAHWGTIDSWDFPDDGVGDCEDYQLLKRRMLVERGLPRRALRMTVVIDELGEGHAVLMARTDRGDYVLDNKINAVLPWERTGYTFIKREGQDGTAWVSLGGRSSPVTTANR